MGLTPGARLGSYEVVARLGAGGMGEVYRARDVSLGRFVAIKILPASVAGNPERLARFDREARALATLNHPNIAQVHGFEEADVAGAPVRVLVMELVEGEDLAERIARGPVAVPEAVAIATQVAEALEVAHTHGIVHRDLKPANIRLRADGVVKLLDFGLAKSDALDRDHPAALENSPTISSPAATARGVILGTAAYMAPEQASGKAVDKRADVWAFGVVLYEMLAGRRPFQGDDVTSVLAQILEREPDWSALPPETPANVRSLLSRCLRKDRRQRWRDCGDARLALEDMAPVVGPGASGARWRHPRVVGAAGVAVGAVAMWGIGAMITGETRPNQAVSDRFALVTADQRLSDGGKLPVAVSRDGRRTVFAAGQRLMQRSANDLVPRPIAGTESVPTPAGARGNTGIAVQPILSPDGESVAYWQGVELRRVPVAGGTPSVICACPEPFGATWGDDGNILFGARRAASSGTPAGVWRVSAAGGVPERLFAIEPGYNALRPQLLPGGAHVLFTLERAEYFDQADIVAVTLATGERHVLVQGAMDGRYLSSGHLVYGENGVLYVVRFDPVSLKVSGTPTPILSGVAQQTSAGSWGGFGFDASDEGSIVYMPAASAALRRVLVWVDRDGTEEVLPTEPRAYQYPRLSSDGQRVALDMRDQQNDVWFWDLSRRTLTRVSVARYTGGPAIWNASGSAVFFGMGVDGTFNLHLQSISGGPPQRLPTTPNVTQFADDATPDGQWLIYQEFDPTTRADLRRLRVGSNAPPEDVIKTPFNEQNADISPDGRWIAYQSDESGRFEVYVRPFPDVNGGRWQVSSNGGTRPLWARDGRELFFLDPERRMTAVAVQPSTTPTFGRSVTLFGTAHLGLEGQQRNYDLSPDGRRFLMVRNLPPPADVPTLVLVRHWTADLPVSMR